jgi:hypothetical protein
LRDQFMHLRNNFHLMQGFITPFQIDIDNYVNRNYCVVNDE